MTAWDNGGATLDRYTILTDGNDVFTCSTNPTSPTGVGIYHRTITNAMDFIQLMDKGHKRVENPPKAVTAWIEKRTK